MIGDDNHPDWISRGVEEKGEDEIVDMILLDHTQVNSLENHIGMDSLNSAPGITLGYFWSA